jgi:hypothetical protein
MGRSPARITGATWMKHRNTVVIRQPEQLAQLAGKTPEECEG